MEILDMRISSKHYLHFLSIVVLIVFVFVVAFKFGHHSELDSQSKSSYGSSTPTNLDGKQEHDKNILPALFERPINTASLPYSDTADNSATHENNTNILSNNRQSRSELTLRKPLEYQNPEGNDSRIDKSQESVETFRSVIRDSCVDCGIVENIVNQMRSDSCHTTINVEEIRYTMTSREMYFFLMGIKNATNTEVFERIVETAKNTVNCDDDKAWYIQTKNLYLAFYSNETATHQ